MRDFMENVVVCSLLITSGILAFVFQASLVLLLLDGIAFFFEEAPLWKNMMAVGVTLALAGLTLGLTGKTANAIQKLKDEEEEV